MADAVGVTLLNPRVTSKGGYLLIVTRVNANKKMDQAKKLGGGGIYVE